MGNINNRIKDEQYKCLNLSIQLGIIYIENKFPGFNERLNVICDKLFKYIDNECDITIVGSSLIHAFIGIDYNDIDIYATNIGELKFLKEIDNIIYRKIVTTVTFVDGFKLDISHMNHKYHDFPVNRAAYNIKNNTLTYCDLTIQSLLNRSFNLEDCYANNPTGCKLRIENYISKGFQILYKGTPIFVPSHDNVDDYNVDDYNEMAELNSHDDVDDYNEIAKVDDYNGVELDSHDNVDDYNEVFINTSRLKYRDIMQGRHIGYLFSKICHKPSNSITYDEYKFIIYNVKNISKILEIFNNTLWLSKYVIIPDISFGNVKSNIFDVELITRDKSVSFVKVSFHI